MNTIIPMINSPICRKEVHYMSKPLVGILTYRNKNKFYDEGFFRDLVREGRKVGANVFLFSHLDLQADGKHVQGYIPSPSGSWQERIFPWPDVVIDRCRKWDKAFIEMRKKNLFLYANHKYIKK